MRRLLRTVALSTLLAAPLAAQTPDAGGVAPQRPSVVRLGGPRVGVTVVAGGLVDELREHDVAPVFTQFGWQFEQLFFAKGDGLVGVTEWVLLAGGLEQGKLIPSASWLVGLRSPRGVEFGVGPNASAAGLALAIAGGATIRYGFLNIPVNLAVVPGRDGVRVSVLSGFNMAR